MQVNTDVDVAPTRCDGASRCGHASGDISNVHQGRTSGGSGACHTQAFINNKTNKCFYRRKSDERIHFGERRPIHSVERTERVIYPTYVSWCLVSQLGVPVAVARSRGRGGSSAPCAPLHALSKTGSLCFYYSRV